MKIFTGKVVSTKMKNTVTVLVDSTFMHRLYGKRYTRTKKYHVHDEYGFQIGDVVNFVASKPYSRIIKWKVIDLKKGKKKTADSVKKKEAIKKDDIKPVVGRKSSKKIK